MKFPLASQLTCLLFPLALLSGAARATNYDEAKVGDYTLPDVLTAHDGMRITNVAAWFAQRRPEILELYRSQIFGEPQLQLPYWQT